MVARNNNSRSLDSVVLLGFLVYIVVVVAVMVCPVDWQAQSLSSIVWGNIIESVCRNIERMCHSDTCGRL